MGVSPRFWGTLMQYAVLRPIPALNRGEFEQAWQVPASSVWTRVRNLAQVVI